MASRLPGHLNLRNSISMIAKMFKSIAYIQKHSSHKKIQIPGLVGTFTSTGIGQISKYLLTLKIKNVRMIIKQKQLQRTMHKTIIKTHGISGRDC